VFGTSVFAQKAETKVSKLPANIASWNGQDADKILKDPSISIRLKRLLGTNNYKSFSEYFETQTPIEKKENLLFASGCMIHACTHLESAVAIDLVNNTIHAAIYNEIKNTKYFNEKNSKTPEPITNWAKRLEGRKKDVGTEVSRNKPDPILIDSFRYANREDMMARVDSFTVQMQNNPKQKGYIIIKGAKSARTSAEKEIKAYIKMRAFVMKNFVFLNRNGKKMAEIELWLVPPGAKPPTIKKKSPLKLSLNDDDQGTASDTSVLVKNLE